jgi:hypothetical protein
MEEQFMVLGHQIKALTTQFSNMGGYNEDGSRNLFMERRKQGRQHLVQAHAIQQVSRFKLDIPKFQSCLQSKEFMVAEKNIKFPQKRSI